ncbi:MAG: hypothetical protein ACKVHI_02865 [Candidatus Puniceispirillales bacterium]|jgi:hypothetical protein|tara:strand:- start:4911 stop:5549 length:639 start_codon:yes stop_codon:yes gene_type:complete
MANILKEVDEDIRKERYSNLWSKYGKYLIGLIVLIVIIFSLTQFYQSQIISSNEKILEDYFLASEKIEKKQFELANKTFDSVYVNGNKTLSAFSKFKLADALLSEDRDAAIQQLKDLSSNPSLENIYRELAMYKYLLLEIETISLAEIEANMNIVHADKKILKLYFQELLGIKYLILNDSKKAYELFSELLIDEETPFDLKMRLEKLILISE